MENTNLRQLSNTNGAANVVAQIRPAFNATAAFDVARAAAKAASQSALLVTNNASRISTYLFQPVKDTIEINAGGNYPAVQPYKKAEQRIIARAASFGYQEQDRIGDVGVVTGGYYGHYPNHDFYTSNDGKTFEVHGDIRHTYNNLGGPNGILGFPVSDETKTPDGAGRYNHFTNGSIYWSPRTGPAAVWGKVRDAWAASGWERGPLGYPVENQHRMIPIPATDPIVEWCRFENGVIAGDPKGAKIAPSAVISHSSLQALIGNMVNEQFKASPNNVALRPAMEALGVNDYRYDYFTGAVSRAVGFRLHGFHDNGLAPDTDFSIDIWLRFELCSPVSFTEPVSKAFVAILDFLRVKGEGGLPLGQVISGVSEGIHASFYSPDPNHPEIPEGAMTIQQLPTGADVRTGKIDLLDVILNAGGDLEFFVNPLTPPKENLDYYFDFGHERQRQLQDRLDSM
ncbi:MAG TPA: hypothetical protein VLD19_05365 [Chitinophagaceae bacterium]|nr:hypothetical protein [Chitinophagaceae bacterium]